MTWWILTSKMAFWHDYIYYLLLIKCKTNCPQIQLTHIFLFSNLAEGRHCHLWILTFSQHIQHSSVHPSIHPSIFHGTWNTILHYTLWKSVLMLCNCFNSFLASSSAHFLAWLFIKAPININEMQLPKWAACE